jgi:hypothetical protein
MVLGLFPTVTDDVPSNNIKTQLANRNNSFIAKRFNEWMFYDSGFQK